MKFENFITYISCNKGIVSRFFDKIVQGFVVYFTQNMQ